MVAKKKVKFFEGWEFDSWPQAITYAVTTALICIILFLGIIYYFVSHETSGYIYTDTVTYTVESGDTLWVIAKRYSSEAQDVRETINIIQDINGCTAIIYPGQQLEIPVYKNMGGK